MFTAASSRSRPLLRRIRFIVTCWKHALSCFLCLFVIILLFFCLHCYHIPHEPRGRCTDCGLFLFCSAWSRGFVTSLFCGAVGRRASPSVFLVGQCSVGVMSGLLLWFGAHLLVLTHNARSSLHVTLFAAEPLLSRCNRKCMSVVCWLGWTAACRETLPFITIYLLCQQRATAELQCDTSVLTFHLCQSGKTRI